MKTLLLVILSISVSAQNFESQQRQLFVYNTISSGLVAGVGRVINKPENETRGKAFLKGFTRGFIGGSINFTAKSLTYSIPNNNMLELAYPIKGIHSLGSSIIENAASGNKFLEKYSLDIAFLRIDFSNNTTIRVQPMALIGAYQALNEGNININRSLKTGGIVVDRYKFEDKILGTTYSNSVVLKNDRTEEEINFTYAHELVHVLQVREHLSFNKSFDKLDTRLKNKKLYNVTSKYIFLDLNIFDGLYQIQKMKKRVTYHTNFYEFEAEFFSEREYIVR